VTKVLDEVLVANEAYAAAFGDKGSLALPPARRFAILTCMDARLDPARFAGLKEGDAHVIRNAGGRAMMLSVDGWQDVGRGPPRKGTSSTG
jgi:carbonic anhydrase